MTTAPDRYALVTRDYLALVDRPAPGEYTDRVVLPHRHYPPNTTVDVVLRDHGYRPISGWRTPDDPDLPDGELCQIARVAPTLRTIPGGAA